MERKPFSVQEVISAVQNGEASKEERARLYSGISRLVTRYTKGGDTKRLAKIEQVKAAFLKAFPAGKRGRKAGTVDAELDSIDLSELI